MLLEKFSDIVLDKGIATVFKTTPIKELETYITTCSQVELENLAIADQIYYNERIITLDEFRQETLLALAFKFTSDVLYGELRLPEEQVNKLVELMLNESLKEDYIKVFDGYRPYNELILVNLYAKQFAIVDNQDMPDEYYEQVFLNLSEIFYNVLEQNGLSSNTSMINTKTMVDSELIQ